MNFKDFREDIRGKSFEYVMYKYKITVNIQAFPTDEDIITMLGINKQTLKKWKDGEKHKMVYRMAIIQATCNCDFTGSINVELR